MSGAQDYLEGLWENSIDAEKIPLWWSSFIANIEDNRHPVTDVVIDDPIIRLDESGNTSICLTCNEPVWVGAYDAVQEWEHYRDNHDDIVVLVRLRNE